MKTELVFKNVRGLVEFAAKHKGRIPYQSALQDTPCLWLVKDEGIYIMPSHWGQKKPKKGATTGTPPPKEMVIYAKGYNPSKDRSKNDPGGFHQKVTDAVGGDDFAACLSLPDRHAEISKKFPDSEFELHVTLTSKALTTKWFVSQK
jgi:hypothetical protein